LLRAVQAEEVKKIIQVTYRLPTAKRRAGRSQGVAAAVSEAALPAGLALLGVASSMECLVISALYRLSNPRYLSI
jgi:hypothetical protein